MNRLKSCSPLFCLKITNGTCKRKEKLILYKYSYYKEATLVNLVKDAYSNGRSYYEVADDYAASIGGYELYDRDITRDMYLEYDDMVIN